MEKENILKSNIFIQDGENKKNMFRIFKGTIIAIIISAILLLIFAALLAYTSVPETTMVPVVIIITGISILAGSMISTRKIRKNGLLNGGIVAAIYIAVLYLLSSCWLVEFSITLNSLIMLITGIVLGMLGGIIGVNINKK